MVTSRKEILTRQGPPSSFPTHHASLRTPPTLLFFLSLFKPPHPTHHMHLYVYFHLVLRFVAEVQPQVMEGFSERASKEVVEAMRTTVTNMLGTLPAKYFNVSISAMADNLAQLMLSVLFTGYMFRNAQYRLELRRSMQTPLLGAAAAPAAAAAAAATPPVPPPAAAAAMEVPAAQSDSTAALTLRSLEKNGCVSPYFSSQAPFSP